MTDIADRLASVRQHEAETDHGPPMMAFEPLTLAPFDRRLLEQATRPVERH